MHYEHALRAYVLHNDFQPLLHRKSERGSGELCTSGAYLSRNFRTPIILQSSEQNTTRIGSMLNTPHTRPGNAPSKPANRNEIRLVVTMYKPLHIFLCKIHNRCARFPRYSLTLSEYEGLALETTITIISVAMSYTCIYAQSLACLCA